MFGKKNNLSKLRRMAQKRSPTKTSTPERSRTNELHKFLQEDIFGTDSESEDAVSRSGLESHEIVNL